MRKLICPLFLVLSLNCNLVLSEAAGYEIVGEPEVFYELRTYTANPGKLEALEERFRTHTMALFEKHGIQNIQYPVQHFSKSVQHIQNLRFRIPPGGSKYSKSEPPAAHARGEQRKKHYCMMPGLEKDI